MPKNETLSRLAKERNYAERLRTPEVRAKVAAKLRGIIRSPETRLKQSESRKRAFTEGRITPWNKGNHSPNLHKRGANAGRSWKGGRQVTKTGYILIHQRDHPNADSRGLIPEHRLVMANLLGRALQPWESVHHKNTIRSDNRPENLILVLRGVHKGDIRCPFCSKHFGIR